jgi:hypothetical protein
MDDEDESVMIYLELCYQNGTQGWILRACGPTWEP